MRAPRHRRGVRVTQRPGPHGPTFAVMRKLLCLALFAASPAFACITITQQPQPATLSPWDSAPGLIATRVEATAPSAIRYQWYEGEAADASRPFIGATDADFCPPPPEGSFSRCSWGTPASTAPVWVRLEADCGTVDSDDAIVKLAMVTQYATVIYTKEATPGWEVLGGGEFSGDGRPDFLLYNQTSRELVIWRMADQAVLSTEDFFDQRVAPSWTPVAVADMDGDSDPDLLLQQAATNLIVVWTMDGRHVVSTENFVGASSPGWTLKTAGDFDRDGDSDLVLVNGQQTVIWELDALTIVDTEHFLPVRNAPWWLMDAGDFDGDGWTDLLLMGRNHLALWQMSSFTVLSTNNYFPQLGMPYVPRGHADFDGNGRLDLITGSWWSYASPGTLYLITLNPEFIWKP